MAVKGTRVRRRARRHDHGYRLRSGPVVAAWLIAYPVAVVVVLLVVVLLVVVLLAVVLPVAAALGAYKLGSDTLLARATPGPA